MDSFENLVGKTLRAIENTGDELIFTLSTGEQYRLFHEQDCCESVYIADIVGNLNELIGLPILLAEEAMSDKNPIDVDDDSFTWTFYKLATNRGAVTVRWYGRSNGYYSERVDWGPMPGEEA